MRGPPDPSSPRTPSGEPAPPRFHEGFTPRAASRGHVAEPFLIVFLLLAGIALALWFFTAASVRAKIREDAERRGLRVVSIDYAWSRNFFEKDERVYQVVCHDAQGNRHEGYAKGRLFGDVYWTAGAPGLSMGPPANAPAPESELERLREENRRLREELERQRRGA